MSFEATSGQHGLQTFSGEHFRGEPEFSRGDIVFFFFRHGMELLKFGRG